MMSLCKTKGRDGGKEKWMKIQFHLSECRSLLLNIVSTVITCREQVTWARNINTMTFVQSGEVPLKGCRQTSTQLVIQEWLFIIMCTQWVILSHYAFQLDCDVFSHKSEVNSFHLLQVTVTLTGRASSNNHRHLDKATRVNIFKSLRSSRTTANHESISVWRSHWHMWPWSTVSLTVFPCV